MSLIKFYSGPEIGKNLMGGVCNTLESGSGITYTVVMCYYYYYLLQLSCQSLAVVLTLVQTKQIKIN